MTISDYHMTMKDRCGATVGVAELKARLSYYLKLVRGGRPLTVVDRTTPIAKLVPHAGTAQRLRVRKALRRLKDVKLPPPEPLHTDSLSILLEDRNSR